MASRYSRESLFEQRADLLSPVRPPPRPRSEADFYDRRDDRRPARSRDTDVDVRVRERSRERERDPFSRYYRDERADNGGALVLRQREVETVDRDRRRAPSQSGVRVIRQRSLSRSPSPDRDMERVVTRVVQRDRERSPTPSSSPSPDRQRIRIVEHSRSRAPSPSPSPPPEQRPVIKGPVIEREVITHYTDVDHGVVYAGQPTPPPPPPEPTRRRDLEVGVYTSRNSTEVDISEPKRRERPHSARPPMHKKAPSSNEVVVRSDRNRLEVAVDDHRPFRSHSATPARSRYTYSDIASEDTETEADYIESRIDDRGQMGEAYNGVTRDWTIVDVPPGTERVRMDGTGGGAAEVTWQRYNGVRRTRFIPGRDDEKMKVMVRDRERDRDRDRGHDRINVQIIEDGRRRDREINIDEDDRRVALRAPADDGMWTEITKDLVNREAIERVGYEYTETEYFFYVLRYLHYDEVQELVQLTDRIRRSRRHKHQRHDSKYSHDEIDIDVRQRRRSKSRPRHRFEDEEHEVIIDRHTPRSYYR